MDKIPVVIPYLASEAQGRELVLAVSGWRKHFKEDYIIIIVGDYHPVVETGDDIVFIDCPRVPDVPGEYRAHLDHVNKFRKVFDVYPQMSGFIYSCDDIYAVNDFDIIDVKVLKVKSNAIQSPGRDTNAWRKNNIKTRDVLLRNGLPARDYVCHLPVWYDRNRLEAIWDKYDCAHNSYVVEQLYFNTYFRDRIPILLNEKFDGFKYANTHKAIWKDSMKWAFKNKIWIMNNVNGWSEELESVLAEHYGL